MSKRGGAKITKVCQNCGKSFMAYLIEVRRREVKFCSVGCYKNYRKRNKLTTSERNRRQKERNHKTKKEVLYHYGGSPPKCTRCGITNTNVLCLDHIEGGGTQNRVDTRHWGTNLYHYLKRNDYPKGYQVLCANCNMEKFIVEGK